MKAGTKKALENYTVALTRYVRAEMLNTIDSGVISASSIVDLETAVNFRLRILIDAINDERKV